MKIIRLFLYVFVEVRERSFQACWKLLFNLSVSLKRSHERWEATTPPNDKYRQNNLRFHITLSVDLMSSTYGPWSFLNRPTPSYLLYRMDRDLFRRILQLNVHSYVDYLTGELCRIAEIIRFVNAQINAYENRLKSP